MPHDRSTGRVPRGRSGASCCCQARGRVELRSDCCSRPGLLDVFFFKGLIFVVTCDILILYDNTVSGSGLQHRFLQTVACCADVDVSSPRLTW